MKRGRGKGEGGRVRPQAELLIYVQPRGRRTEAVGKHGDAIKIRVAAAPVDGAANDELVRFLASRLHTARSAIAIVSGAASRLKRVRITGLTTPEAINRLTQSGEGTTPSVPSGSA